MKKAVLYVVGICSLLGLCLVQASEAAMDGIYKDVPQNETGARYAVYLQTYTTGSTVAMLLDSSGAVGRLYAFLDPDYSDGLDAVEIAGANVSLSLSGLDTETPSATVKIAGVEDTVTLYKWFEAAEAEGDPVDGIYKDVPAPQATPFGLYFQTYPAYGSAVAILTPNGGSSYYAFLQPNYQGEFDVGDLLGAGAHFAGTISAQGTSSFTFTMPGGSAYSNDLTRWFEAPAESLDLRGTLLYNGAPMSNLTSVAPTIWVRNEISGQTAAQVVASYDTSTAAYELKNLPPNAGLSFVFHVTGSEPTLPGNYRTFRYVNPADIPQAERDHYDVNIHVILRLLSPYDNSQITLPWTEPYPEHSTPVLFQWEPVAGATLYDIDITRCGDDANAVGYGCDEIVVSEDTPDTQYSAALVPSAPNEHYILRLNAFNGSILVGQYMTTYQAGFGWDYQFKAVAP